MTSPTQRALKLLRGRGWKVDIVEYWNGFSKKRKDLFGFGDLVAIDLGRERNIIVQVTSASNHSARKAKILSIPEAADWVKAGGLILILTFRKKPNGRYEAREEYIYFNTNGELYAKEKDSEESKSSKED